MNLMRRLSLHAIRALPSSGTVNGFDNDKLLSLVREGTISSPVTPLPDLINEATVLDFGGGFGLHFRRAVLRLPAVRWAIVEIPNLVREAQELETDQLRFFTKIADALAWLGPPPDAIYSEGALQYTSEPETSLSELCAIGAKRMIWARTMLTPSTRAAYTQVRLLAESGPGLIFSRKRIATKTIRMNDCAFIQAHRDYEILKRSGSYEEGENFAFQITRIM